MFSAGSRTYFCGMTEAGRNMAGGTLSRPDQAAYSAQCFNERERIMHFIDVCVASAFSKNNRGGNQAGVVLQGASLNRKEKMRTAHQLGYSETAFLSQSELADYKLEYFTPTGEVPLCGHATIAAFVVLNYFGQLKKCEYTIETKSGILSIAVKDGGVIFMQQNTPEFYETLELADVVDCLGFNADTAPGNLPVQIVSTGLRDIIVPVENPLVLETMVPDFAAVSKLSQKWNCVGIHAFSLVEDGKLTAVCRNFAPLYGIDEESATGTSCCALACYLYQYGVKRNQYVFEQGRSLNRISELYVSVNAGDDTVDGVWIGGCGYLVSLKTIEVE